LNTVHNARIQLIATAINNVGVGSILAGIVAPVVNGTIGDWHHILTWCTLGADLIAMAQIVLGRLRA
jgi:hypothetical protein